MCPRRLRCFPGTIASNVAFGDNGREEFTGEDVKDAVRTAQAEEFVSGWRVPMTDMWPRAEETSPAVSVREYPLQSRLQETGDSDL